MKSTFKKYLYKAGALSASGVMALSLCAPALTASANAKTNANHSKVQRVFFWDETPTTHKSHVHKHAKKGRKARRTRKSRARKGRSTKRSAKKATGRKAKKPARARKSRKNSRARKELNNDKRILANMNKQLNHLTTQLHHHKARRVYNTLRKHGYSYNQTIAILASVQENTHGRYMNRTDRYYPFGYFNTGRNYRKQYNRYAKRTHQRRYNIVTQIHFLNRGKRSFKKAKGTQLSLYRQFNRNLIGVHSYFTQSHHKAVHYIRLARHARTYSAN